MQLCVCTLINSFCDFGVSYSCSVEFFFFKSSQEFNYLITFRETFSKTSEKRENFSILQTTYGHCTLMAENVQQLSRSDCSICVSILVEYQLIESGSNNCEKKVVRMSVYTVRDSTSQYHIRFSGVSSMQFSFFFLLIIQRVYQDHQWKRH